MSATPKRIQITDYLSPQAFWFIVAAFLVGCAVLALVRRAQRKDDAKVEPIRTTPYHCAARGCNYVRDLDGYHCPTCRHTVPSDTPYDYETDGAA